MNDNTPTRVSAVIARDALAKAALVAAHVIERRNTIPILGNLLIAKHGAGIRIEGTDLDITARVTLDGAADDGFAATLPAHLFRDAMRKNACEHVAIDIAPHTERRGPDDRTMIRATLDFEGSAIALDGLPVTDWPADRNSTITHRFELPAHDLAAALRRVAFCISTEEVRYYLNGVYLHAFPCGPGKGTLRLVATDGHRMAVAELPLPEGAAGMPGVIVPAKTVRAIVKLMDVKPPKAKKGETAAAPAMVTLEIGQCGINAECGRVRIESKVIDGTFPDYGRVVPLGNDKTLTLDVDDLIRAVDRVTTIQSERGRAVKLEIERGRLRLSVKNPDTGESHADIELPHCDFDHPPMDIGFNSTYLLAILDQFKGGPRASDPPSRVTFKLADPGSPTLIHAATSRNPHYVLMPMRV